MLRSTVTPGAGAARGGSGGRPLAGAWPRQRAPLAAAAAALGRGLPGASPAGALPRRGAPARAAPAAAAAAQAPPEDAAGLSTLVDAQMTWPARTRGAGKLREGDAGAEVTVCGWVDRNRNMGGLCFLDVRDHTGLLQVRPRAWGCGAGRMGQKHTWAAQGSSGAAMQQGRQSRAGACMHAERGGSGGPAPPRPRPAAPP
jgi:hypothetical protein